MKVRLLGPVELDLDVGGKRERALVAMLALAGGQPVPRTELVDGLWGAALPEDPEGSLARLAERVASSTPGLQVTAESMTLDLARSEVDALTFEDGLRAARAEPDATRAASRLQSVLELWRGEPLTGLLDVPFAGPAAARLEELRLEALEERVSSELRLGHAAAQVDRLRELVQAHPTRQQLWALLMTALYRDYRAEEAVAVYAEARARIADELGIEPGEALRRLEAAILEKAPLDSDPAVDPGAAAPRAPTRIPTLRSETFGRDDLCGRVRDLLDRPGQSVVTLTGPGGAGKTRVAAVVATTLQEQGAQVVWISARDGIEAPALLDDVASALGVEVAGDGRLQLADGVRALVVLDNLESLARADAQLLALAEACPAVDLLVTSRLRLNLAAERVVDVPPLDVPDEDATYAQAAASASVQLFVDTAARAATDFELRHHVPQVVELCRLLDGVPLALELAAARVHVAGLSGILSSLRRNLDVLRTTAIDVPERQRALATTIEWSLDRLTPEQRVVAGRLAIFEGGFTLESVEAICVDLPDVVDSVAALMEVGLLRSTESRIEIRYAVPRTVRAHLRVQLEGSVDAVTIRERLADHLDRELEVWADQLDGEQGRLALARFEDEMRDIEASVDWLLTVGRIQRAVRITLLATAFWIAAGRLREALTRTQQVLDHVAAESPEAGRLKSAAGRLAYNLTDWDVAAAQLAGATRIAEAAGDEPTLAAARCYLGGTKIMTGDHHEGKALATLSSDAAERLGLYPLVLEALSLKAICHMFDSELADERATHERRLQLAREHHDDARTADTCNTLAEIALDEGQAARAVRYASTCVELAGSRLPLERRDATITMARATAVLGDVDGARALLGRAVADSYRIGQTLAIAQCARIGATLAFGQGDADLAVRLFGVAESLAPSPRGNGVPVEADFAAALDEARADLGRGPSDDAWELGATMPLADLRERLELLVTTR